MTFRSLLAGVCLVAGTLGARAAPPQVYPAQIVVFWSCASACNDDLPPTPDNPMCFAYHLNEPGRWIEHMQTNIYKDYEDGYRRFLLHLPFGSEYDNGGMDLDQPVDDIEVGLGYVMRNFYEALAWAEIYMPDAEFIVYLGGKEDDLTNAMGNDRRFYDHWNRMTGANWNMVLLDFPSTSVVFDASTRYLNGSPNWGPGDPYFQFIKLFQSYKNRQGRLVYVEALPVNEKIVPSSEDPHLYDWQRTMPWVAFETVYQRQIVRWALHDPPLESPESIRMLIRSVDKDLWKDRGGLWAWAADVARNGHTPAITRTNSTGLFPWNDMTADELAYRINAAAAY